MRETERAHPEEEFRQGDIIRLEGGVTMGGTSRLGIIVNADCDLVHGKLDGVIAYLPIYPFKEYVDQFWTPKYVEEIRRGYLNDLSAICRLSAEEIDDLVLWLRKGAWQEIHARLSATVDFNRRQDKAIREALEALVKCCSPQCDSFKIFAWRCGRDKHPENYTRKQIDRAYKDMGDGHLFINDIIGDDGIGFVIRMRRIYTINVDCCFQSESDRLKSTDGDQLTAARCARLAAPFRFKFAQMFAYQFSRIGLPDDTVALNQLAIDNLLDDILEHAQ